MFHRTLAAILTAPNSTSASSTIFVSLDVESDVEVVERKKRRIAGTQPPQDSECSISLTTD